MEQCVISGVAKEDMHKIYCDPWALGYDERFGSNRRLQQALIYDRPEVDNCQYQYPLDFCAIWDPIKQAVIALDIPKTRRPLVKSPPLDYHHIAIQRQGGYRTDLKPLQITQPQGVSFDVSGTGREVEWQNWKFHVGFNYREGLVFNNITFNDKGTQRPIFYRMSLAEMVVP